MPALQHQCALCMCERYVACVHMCVQVHLHMCMSVMPV